MLTLFRRSQYSVAFTVFLLTGVSAQSQDSDFGWSLKVPAAVSKRTENGRSSTKQVSPTDDGSITIETRLVLSDVLVQDASGAHVAGLTAADFEIFEDGARQVIDVFEYGDSAIPRSIILVIDHSRSQRNHIDRSIAASKVLVDSLRPTDRMAIVSDNIELVTNFTSDKSALKAGLESLKERCLAGRFGKSLQYSALFAAVNERVVRGVTRNIVIFQTDGDELAALQGGISWGGGPRFGLGEIVRAAKRKGVTIYSVFTGLRLKDISVGERVRKVRDEYSTQLRMLPQPLGSSQPNKQIRLSTASAMEKAAMKLEEEEAIALVARRSGGFAQSLESPDQAIGVYERILSDIGRRYLVGYYPASRTRGDVRDREVRVTLRNNLKYRVVGGRTYIAY